MTLTVVDRVNSLSGEMESLLDFIAADSILGEDFQTHVDENNIKIEKQSQLNIALVEYLLDGKMQDGTRVLDYYTDKNAAKNKIVVQALKNSVTSVFEIKKVLKNAYETYSLTSQKDFCLIPLVKMTNLRGIAKGDFIRARAIELEGEFYLLEIYDVIPSLNFYKAASEAVKCLITSPKCAVFKNEDKKKELKKTIKTIGESFEEVFKDFDKNKIITTNKLADNLINAFNEGQKDIASYIKEPDEYKFFDVKEFWDNGDFIQNAIGGFSHHQCVYDVGLYFDKNEGLYIIPFLGTFFKAFEIPDTQGAKDCIIEFLKSDKVPKSVILYAAKKYENFLKVINCALDTNFESTIELIEKFKGVDEEKFSPTLVLYNSKIFGEILGIKEEDEKKSITDAKDTGRNDPCPCGSGKKYKRCCGGD